MADEQESPATDRSGRDHGAGRGRQRFASEKRQRGQHHAQQQTKPFPRKWMMYAPPLHAETRVPLATSTFRVVSFNTLAGNAVRGVGAVTCLPLMHVLYYLVVKDGALASPQGWMYEWSYRGSRLIREIVAWAPHIVCLQEVDHYDDFFEPEMRKARADAVHERLLLDRRTGEETHDGCAIFVKGDMFSIVESRPIEFRVAAHPVLDRDNVALAAVLEWKDGASHCSSPQQFIVATTHVLFNPKRGDVKLAQLEMLAQMLSEWRSEHSPALPVVLCGDFNLEPHSALYHFLSTGLLDVSSLSRAALSGQNGYDNRAFQNAKFINEHDTSRHHGNGTAAGRFQLSKARSRRGKSSDFAAGTVVTHDLGLASAYAQSPDAQCTGEPKFTIFHSDSKGAVDYMWFTKDAVHCHGVLEMTPAGILFAQKALPTPHQSSDHLSLVADFSLRAMHAG